MYARCGLCPGPQSIRRAESIVGSDVDGSICKLHVSMHGKQNMNSN